jgi:type I restriction enzyme S subunit
MAVGGAQQNLNAAMIKDLPISAPSLPTQTAIAEILSSLDDKIELNNKINQELENLAQTLFNRWFIDFEFPDENGEPYKSSGGEMVDSELGEIPKGWVLDSLDKIADFLNGLALQKFPAASDFDFLPVIKIRELRQKDTTNSDKASSAIPAKYIIHNGDVLFSWSGTLMVDFWTNGKGALNQHLFKVTSNQFPKWFYYLWTKHHLSEFIKIAESKATTMGHIQRQHLSDAKVVIPNEINNFSVIIEPFITKIINNRIESFELIQLRDSLLPKLISGELEVKQTIN